jgi:hypothetical protein
MSFLLDNLFGLIYWLAILGGMAWWFWSVRSMRRCAVPPKRTKVEDAELTRLRAHLAQPPGRPRPEKPFR